MSSYLVIPKRHRHSGAALAEEEGTQPDRIRQAGNLALDVAAEIRKRVCRDVGVRRADSAGGGAALLEGSSSHEVIVTPLAGLGAMLIQAHTDLAHPLRRLAVVEKVLSTDRHRIFFSDPVPTDSGPIPDLWHLRSTNVDALHAAGFKGQGMWIGFVDSGIDRTHLEFTGKAIHFNEFNRQGPIPGALVRDGASTGHGTHVAALAAGNSCGVAPAANIAMALALREGGGNDFNAIARALDWLAQIDVGRPSGRLGVDIVSLSFGYTDEKGRARSTDVYRAATDLLRRDNLIPVAAAIGNSGKGCHASPGNYRGVFGVGAINVLGNWWDGSCRGHVSSGKGRRYKPDVVAPGENVWSAIPGNSYAAKSGSSMATPIAAGVGLLLLQKHGSASFPPSRLRSHCRMIRPLPDSDKVPAIWCR